MLAKYDVRCNYPRLSKKQVSPAEDRSVAFERGFPPNHTGVSVAFEWGFPRNHTGVSVAFSVGSAEVHLLSGLDPKGQLVLGRG
jgi:hypothetical protein